MWTVLFHQGGSLLTPQNHSCQWNGCLPLTWPGCWVMAYPSFQNHCRPTFRQARPRPPVSLENSIPGCSHGTSQSRDGGIYAILSPCPGALWHTVHGTYTL